MKSKREIEAREKNLRRRYKLRLVNEKLSRTPCNCVFNKVVEPEELVDNTRVFSISPRVSKTLVVFPNPDKVGSCTFGTPNGSWNGTICDSIDVSRNCPHFRNLLSPEEITSTVESNFSNSEWIHKTHPDLSSIMWVTGSVRNLPTKANAISLLFLRFYSFMMGLVIELIGKFEK